MEARTEQDWIEANPSMTRTRRAVVKKCVEATGLSLEQLVNLLKNPKADRAKIARRFIEYLKKPVHNVGKNRPMADTTICIWLYCLVSWFKHLCPEWNGSSKFVKKNFPVYAKMKSHIPRENRAVALSREEVTGILHWAKGARFKAMFSIWISTGCRIQESVSLKLEDLRLDETPAIVSLNGPVSSTKNHNRESILSREAVSQIKAGLKEPTPKGAALLFPSECKVDQHGTIGGRKGRCIEVHPGVEHDKWRVLTHQHQQSARYALYRALDHLDLNKLGKYNRHRIHPHTFRATFLALARFAGFPEDYAKTLAGQDTGTQESYIVSDEVKKLWLYKCEGVFTFLKQEVVQKTELLTPEALKQKEQIDSQKQQIDKLTAAVLGMAGRAGVPIDNLVKEGVVKMGRLAKLSQRQLEELEAADNHAPKSEEVDGGQE